MTRVYVPDKACTAAGLRQWQPPRDLANGLGVIKGGLFRCLREERGWKKDGESGRDTEYSHTNQADSLEHQQK